MCLCVCITFWYKKMFLIMKILMCCKAKQDCAAEKALVILLIWCMRDACLSIDWFNADCSASSMSHLRQRQIYIFYGRLFLREIRYMHDCTWMWWAQADKWKQGTSEPPLNRQRSIVIGNHAIRCFEMSFEFSVPDDCLIVTLHSFCLFLGPQWTPVLLLEIAGNWAITLH